MTIAMNRATALLSAAMTALTLAACSQGDAAADAKTAEAASSADIVQTSGPTAPAGYAVRPGFWETTSTDADDGESEVTRSCITPEEARVEVMRTQLGGPQDDGCTYSRSQFFGGKIDLHAACNKDGVSGTTSMKGGYGADHIDYVLDTTMKIGGEPVSLKMRVKSRRIADACPAEEN